MPRADHPNPAERFDRFCELLSLDIPMPEIARRLQMSRGGAYAMLVKLRAKYGWQAA
jgi:hypothetical protein